jgi:hypothetical protein
LIRRLEGVFAMPVWVWISIIVVAIVVLAAIVWMLSKRRKREALQGQFGPEYDRTVRERDSRRAAESELQERQRRREEFEIRPLAPLARARYADEWGGVQAKFVDDPGTAVQDANGLVLRVMGDRGYPMEEFDQRAADISVDHPDVVENYRAAHHISLLNGDGRASTEDLRRAMVHYRSLFEELLGEEARESRAAR